MRTERINQSKIRTRCNKLKTNVNEKQARKKVVKETNRVHEARATAAASQPASSNTAQELQRQPRRNGSIGMKRCSREPSFYYGLVHRTHRTCVNFRVNTPNVEK